MSALIALMFKVHVILCQTNSPKVHGEARRADRASGGGRSVPTSSAPLSITSRQEEEHSRLVTRQA